MGAAVLFALVLVAVVGLTGGLLAAMAHVRREDARHPDRRRRPNGVHTARLERSLHESVRFAIFERDGWRCHLCLAPVYQGRTTPTEMAHVDLLVPRAQGGSLDDTNLKTSCLRCKILKGSEPDNDAVRRAVAAWQDWANRTSTWSPQYEADLETYRRLARQPRFRRAMSQLRWSDGLTVKAPISAR